MQTNFTYFLLQLSCIIGLASAWPWSKPKVEFRGVASAANSVAYSPGQTISFDYRWLGTPEEESVIMKLSQGVQFTQSKNLEVHSVEKIGDTEWFKVSATIPTDTKIDDGYRLVFEHKKWWSGNLGESAPFNIVAVDTVSKPPGDPAAAKPVTTTAPNSPAPTAPNSPAQPPKVATQPAAPVVSSPAEVPNAEENKGWFSWLPWAKDKTTPETPATPAAPETPKKSWWPFGKSNAAAGTVASTGGAIYPWTDKRSVAKFNSLPSLENKSSWFPGQKVEFSFQYVKTALFSESIQFKLSHGAKAWMSKLLVGAEVVKPATPDGEYKVSATVPDKIAPNEKYTLVIQNKYTKANIAVSGEFMVMPKPDNLPQAATMPSTPNASFNIPATNAPAVGVAPATSASAGYVAPNNYDNIAAKPKAKKCRPRSATPVAAAPNVVVPAPPAGEAPAVDSGTPPAPQDIPDSEPPAQPEADITTAAPGEMPTDDMPADLPEDNGGDEKLAEDPEAKMSEPETPEPAAVPSTPLTPAPAPSAPKKCRPRKYSSALTQPASTSTVGA